MTPERYRRVVALFQSASPLPADQRAALLAGEEEGLRRDVEAMLAQDERRSLLRTAGGVAPGVAALESLGQAGAQAPIPERLGEYLILGVLGAGAMGTVYRAQQQQPLREVALKTIHWWVLSPAAVERFRFEAQALAQLQHPGIPQVYEVSEDVGQLSYAMELVEGPSLSEYVRGLHGDVRQVLAVLAQVADAVHHAHLRGLVHRDLKPENIRVTASGQPKVLDFGISQPVDAAGRTLGAGEVSGTLAYMAPEQLSPEGGLDIRADVYALGVIAYELLGGQLPFGFSGLTFEQARARVEHGEVTTLAQRVPALAGDVSLIVARAMAHRREERYASAAELAEDLRRHLRFQPVQAHPDSRAYRLSRFVRRNRLAVAASASVLLALIGGGATSFALFRQAEAARQRAVELRADAEAARDSAQSAGAKSAATVDFLSQLLLEAAPNRALGRTVTVREAIDKAAQRLDRGALKEQPEVEASVRLTLAQAYRALGLEELTYQQVLAAAAISRDGRLAGRHEAAEPLLALADVKNARGEFAEAQEAIAQSLAFEREHHPQGPHPDLARTLYISGQIRREAGDLKGAIVHFEEARAMGRLLVERGELPESEQGNTLNQLAQVHTVLGQYSLADGLFRQALEADIRQFGPDHPEVATALHNLAWLALESGRSAEAGPHLERALAIRLQVLGPRHPRVGILLSLKASVAIELGRWDEAERATHEALSILEEAYGALHPQVLRNGGLRARVLLRQGKLSQAREAAEATWALHRQRYGDEGWVTAEAATGVARVMLAQGQVPEAQALLRRSHATLLAQLGPLARPTREAEALRETAPAGTAHRGE